MRKDLDKIIYLDYNATTPFLPEVLEEVNLYALEYFANPNSAHIFGKFVREKLEHFRIKIAQLINAEPEEIIFTSGGTESNYLAILGVALQKERGHILISAFEHPSILKLISKLFDLGFEIDLIPVNSKGYVEPDEVEKRIKDNTILVSVMYANDEIGTIQPVKEIGEICSRKGIIFHTDACQAVGKIPVNVKEINCELLSITGHKMYAPKGIGVLYIKKGIKIEPLFQRTEAVPLIAGLSKAAEIAQRDLEAEAERLIFLREKLYEGLKEIYPKLYRFGIPEKTLPNTLTVSFVGKNGVQILSELKEVCASTKFSNTMLALKVAPEIAEGTIRFSLGKYTNLDEIERVLELFSHYFRKNV